MPAVLVAVSTVTQNSLHPLSTFSITACHLLDFMVQVKITEADALTSIRMPPHPDYRCRHLHHPTVLGQMPFLRQLPIYPGLALNNAGFSGLHTRWLGLVYTCHNNVQKLHTNLYISTVHATTARKQGSMRFRAAYKKGNM